ncbi:MAG: hypothetical protein KDB07_12360 [Planctomycetes bacterium]|nr:hypothetical protein [Planctomycetota bacterium]
MRTGTSTYVLAALAVALLLMFASHSYAADVSSAPAQQGQLIQAEQESAETRSGTIVGKARVLANGAIAFRVAPHAGVFQKRAAEFEVVVPVDTVVNFFPDLNAADSQRLSFEKAVEKLNTMPALISISGSYDSNTNTFRAQVALDIVA